MSDVKEDKQHEQPKQEIVENDSEVIYIFFYKPLFDLFFFSIKLNIIYYLINELV